MASGSLLLLIGAFVFLAGTLSGGLDQPNFATLFGKMLDEMSSPRIPLIGGVLFAFACTFLNSFLILVTEPHWLRVWMFGEKETKLQVRSLSFTCLVWLILIALGALASVAVSADEGGTKITGGDDVIIFFLTQMTNLSPLFAVIFWVAGMAALFSTSDAQIYSSLLIIRFDAHQGTIINTASNTLRPALTSGLAAALFTTIYVLVRLMALPFEQLVLLLLPSCLNTVPALILASRGIPQLPGLLWVSIVLYFICAVFGLAHGPTGQVFAVAAPLMPLLASLIALFYKPKEATYAAAIR